MEATSSKTESRSGFTLIEMLAVIVIIGILASLITAAAISARRRVRQAAVRLELSNIGNALEAYKAKFGEYPPDFTDGTGETVRRHLRKAFPRIRDYGPFGATGTLNTGTYNPETALVFWLGGMRDPNAKRLTGFSANPINPFQPITVSKSRVGPFYDFDTARLGPGDAVTKYYPDMAMRIDNKAAPIVYFRSRNGSYPDKYVRTTPDEDRVGPMRRRPSSNTSWDNSPWANEHKYQILCAGLDGRFGNAQENGVGRWVGSDAGYNDYNYDNITNFSNSTLEDELK